MPCYDTKRIVLVLHHGLIYNLLDIKHRGELGFFLVIMDILKIQKAQLQGQVRLSGAKNSSLRLLAASLLTEEVVELYNSPNGLLDMQVHIKMLNKIKTQYTCSTVQS